MDRAHFPLQASVANSAPAEQRPKGHIYTTAGTIYDPSTVAPLQPPARRGRAMNKWGPGGAAVPPELLLLSSDLSEYAHMRGPRGRNMALGPAAQHTYLPLQQNYDRAVSPIEESGPDTSKNKAMSTPRSQPVRQTGVALSKTNVGEMNGHDTDDEVVSKSLDQLPVKALFNLMSYPNPNQEKARRRWEEARQGGGNAQAPPGPFASRAAYAGSSGKASPAGLSQQHQNARERANATRKSAFGIRVDAAEAHICSPPYRLAKSTVHTSNVPHIHQPIPISAANSQRASELFGSNGTLATGPGAPRPLTAGPPGQRQYRPSTFESTVRALRGNSHGGMEEQKSLAVTTDDASHKRTEIGVSCAELMSMSDLSADSEPLGPSARRPVGAIGPPSKTSPKMQSVEDILAALHAGSNIGASLAPDNPKFPPPFSRQQPAPAQCSNTSVSSVKAKHRTVDELRRDDKARQCWRSGSERWHKAVENQIEILLSDVGPGAESNKNIAEIFLKPQLTTEEARQVLTSEHCRPIFTLALDNIEKFLDHFGWIYGSDKGLRS